jgi:TonB family protein
VGVAASRSGLDHRVSAPIGSARPDVTQGPVAIPANEAARPRDDVDSDQEVATTVRSLLHASTAGGAPGEGQGGTGGGGESGAGGASGAGSHARPLGVGEGDVFDFWTSDPRLLPYFRQLHARIDPLWASAFPKSAMLELKQGTVILVFTVSADGRVAVQWPPLRPSGIDEFDRNCADAIRRAAPLPPIPHELGVSSLTIRAPFVASNPIVH